MQAPETYRERLRRQLDDPRNKTAWWIGFAGGTSCLVLIPALLGLIAISSAYFRSPLQDAMPIVVFLALAFPIDVGLGVYCYVRLKRLGEFSPRK